jgi:hypothetical protein
MEHKKFFQFQCLSCAKHDAFDSKMHLTVNAFDSTVKMLLTVKMHLIAKCVCTLHLYFSSKISEHQVSYQCTQIRLDSWRAPGKQY